MSSIENRAIQRAGCIAGLLLAATPAVAQTTWYVNVNATGNNHGHSWNNAFVELQSALDVAEAGDQIWVAAGTYLPDFVPILGQHNGGRDLAFVMRNGVKVYGGFAGGETLLNERDFGTNIAVLSGDLNGDDTPNGNRVDNSYHVVTANNTDSEATLDGFHIVAGFADGPSHRFRGAGVYVDGGSFTLRNCLIADCRATRNIAGIEQGEGGALFIQNGGPSIVDCRMEGNEARFGGAFYANNAAPLLGGCEIMANSAERDGGGAYCFNATPSFNECSMSDNQADGSGGAMFISGGEPWAVDCLFDGNVAGEDGGGIAVVENGAPILARCNVSNNQARNGGGLFAQESNPIVQDCTLDANVATSDGGGAYLVDGAANLSGTSIHHNQTGPASFGGGIYSDADLTAATCLILGNSAELGGGVYALAGTDIRDCQFEANSASDYGGGLYLAGTGVATIHACMFTGNSAVTLGGGMVSTNEGESVVISGSTFTESVSGALYNRESNPTITNCLFHDNVLDSGGAMVNNHASPLILNCTITRNAATGDGGGIYNTEDSHPQVFNTILWENEPDQLFDDLYRDSCSAVGYSLVQGNWPGLTNFDADPLFVDPDNRDYHLAEGSPAIDASDPDQMFPQDATDVDGEPRVQHCRADLGADESPDFADCNDNAQADACEVIDGMAEDCNANLVPDECDTDCNENGIPDTCGEDCNGNWQADECDIDEGISADCNANNAPDECDVADGTSEDCTANGIPDECEADCNANLIADSCDIVGGTSPDCNFNFVPDECDIGTGASHDCNGNQTPDECEDDCNGNGLADECDIADGTSQDCNGDGVPDECVSVPSAYISTETFGGTQADNCLSLAVDEAGARYQAGRFQGTVDFDPTENEVDTHVAIGASDAFVTKFESDGSYAWTLTFGGTLGAGGDFVRITPTGEILVAGTFSGTVDFDPGPGVSTKSSYGLGDVYVSHFTSDGDFVWTRTFGGPENEGIFGIDVSDDGRIKLAGRFRETVDFNVGPGVDARASAGDFDAYIVTLDSNGTYVATTTLGSQQSECAFDLASTPDGGLVVIGEFYPGVDFDPGPDTIIGDTYGENDVFILKLSAERTFDWVHTFGGPSFDQADRLLCDQTGSIIALGSFSGEVDFAPGEAVDLHESFSNNDGYITKLTADGGYQWTQTIGGPSSPLYPTSLSVDQNDSIIAGGSFVGTIDFDFTEEGENIYTSNGLHDIFLTAIGPAGTYRWTHTVGGEGSDGVNDISFINERDLVAAGSFRSSGVDFDPTEQEDMIGNAGDHDGFVSTYRLRSADCNENGVLDACDIADGTSEDTDGNGIPDECEFVQITQSSSCHAHNAGGPNETELCIDLFASEGIEPRQAGVARLQLEASGELDVATLMDENIQVVCSNQVGPSHTVTPLGTSDMLVEFDSPLLGPDCCAVTFDGVLSLAGLPLAGQHEIRPLAGDMDFNGGVTGGDFALIKTHFGESLAGGDLANPKWDFDLSGAVTGGDAALIKPRFGDLAPECP